MAVPNSAFAAVTFAEPVPTRVLLKFQLATCARIKKGNKIPQQTRGQIFGLTMVFHVIGIVGQHSKERNTYQRI